MSYVSKKMAILVNSCDNYEDLWLPFFLLMDKFGGRLKECQMVLNTETKEFSYPGLEIVSYGVGRGKMGLEWGGRLRETLRRIEQPYVLFLMDDFFLREKISEEQFGRFEKCIDWMEQDFSIGAMNLLPLDDVTDESMYQGFCEVKPGVAYRVNAQACIWRKEVLFQSILDKESPWIWEIYGNIRNDILLTSKIYALKWGEKEPYDYGFYNYGHKNEYGRVAAHSGVMRGKWDLSVVKKLFQENGIDVDYTKRGIYKRGIKQVLKDNTIFRWLVVKPYRLIKSIGSNKKKMEEGEHARLMDEYVIPYIK